MKKWIALILAGMMMLTLCAVHAEEAERYEELVVGTGTAFSGNFLSDALGSNTSDQDVRKLIHGYSLVYWNTEHNTYQFSNKVVTAGFTSEDGRTYTLALARELAYNDGTPITAKDYAFSLLLLGSTALKDVAGGNLDLSWIQGGKAYQSGQSTKLEGLRLLGDYQLSVTLDESYSPYFYELKAMDISPLPISVIAPNCDVIDDEGGAYIANSFGDTFSAANLMDTLGSSEGYISHPKVTCGPYQLADYDGSTVTLELNGQYIGDEEGNIPAIPRIIYKYVNPDEAIDMLGNEELDLVVRCARNEQIRNGMALAGGGDFAMKAYSRTGLSFIAFCAQKGPTADINVRKAIAMCLDKNTLTSEYTGNFGTPVNGYYGIGQWMFLMANGSMVPEEGQEAEWADLSMDRVQGYELNPEEAGRLLDEAGWILTEKGESYDPAQGGVRAKPGADALIPLRLKLIYPETNGAGPLLADTFTNHLAQAGIALETEAVPFDQLLQVYYGRTERNCDMILLGTNFGDVFDPSGEYDENGVSRLNGIKDEELRNLAINLRQTEPGNATEYCRRWLAYQARRSEVVSEVPIYSDAYLDFHVAILRNYEPARTGNWTDAIRSAILSDFEPEEEEPAEEEGLEEGEELFEE